MSSQAIVALDNWHFIHRSFPVPVSTILAFGLAPGVVFGTTFGIALKIIRLIDAWRMVVFFLVSSIAYFAAFIVFAKAHEHLSVWAAGYLAGLLGGSLVAFGGGLVIKDTNRIVAPLLLLLLGGVLGAGSGGALLLGWGLWICLGLWQVGFVVAWATLILESRL